VIEPLAVSSTGAQALGSSLGQTWSIVVRMRSYVPSLPVRSQPTSADIGIGVAPRPDACALGAGTSGIARLTSDVAASAMKRTKTDRSTDVRGGWR
jgi:hypothetical protein